MAAIKKAGSTPSVANLVYIQQQNYWRENPKERTAYCRKHYADKQWLKYQICPAARLYNREKSKRRKAQMRKLQTVDKVSVAAIRKRFAEFGDCCAYCGSGGDMEIEHVKPIAARGAHAIYNIVPACASCNSSKRAREMSEWYQAQPFFDELRMRRIHCATCPPPPQQLALALA
jgi:5-methylcytosine-specific restriction endonuclease McrA